MLPESSRAPVETHLQSVKTLTLQGPGRGCPTVLGTLLVTPGTKKTSATASGCGRLRRPAEAGRSRPMTSPQNPATTTKLGFLPLVSTLIAVFLLVGCRVHPIEGRPLPARSAGPTAEGRLLVLRLTDATDGGFLDGFWLDACADPVGELSQLYATQLRATGVFAEVVYADTTDLAAAFEQAGGPSYVLAGEVSKFTSQMHAHWFTWILPTSFLLIVGLPTAPCWGACDIELSYTLSDATGRELIPATRLAGKGYQELFFATWWTEGFVFADTLNQAANETGLGLIAAVLEHLRCSAAASEP